jgi:hypothetical protein
LSQRFSRRFTLEVPGDIAVIVKRAQHAERFELDSFFDSKAG